VSALSAARGIALAADKPVVGLTRWTAYAAPSLPKTASIRSSSAIVPRHDHVYFQVVSGNGNPLISRSWYRSRKPSTPRICFRRIWLARRKNSRRPLAGAGASALQGRSAARARYHLVAWVGAAVSPQSAPAKPYYLRAPDASRREIQLPVSAQPIVS